MAEGKVVGIFIAKKRGEKTTAIDHVHVIPNLGIEGDRYFDSGSNPEIRSKPGRQITFIEMEVIESMRVNDGISISPGQTRRNVITSGIGLNDLVDRKFYVGTIELRGVSLCEPCQSLANQTDQQILQSMEHRGGLRAEIISEGIICIGDPITYEDREIL